MAGPLQTQRLPSLPRMCEEDSELWQARLYVLSEGCRLMYADLFCCVVCPVFLDYTVCTQQEVSGVC